MALGMTNLEDVEIEAAETTAPDTLTWVSDVTGTPLDAAATEKFMDVIIQVSIPFHADAVLGAELHLRFSADGGTTEDTPEVGTFAKLIDVSAGNTVIVSHRVPGMFSYLDVGLKNLEAGGNESITGWSAKYSGSKMTGMVSS